MKYVLIGVAGFFLIILAGSLLYAALAGGGRSAAGGVNFIATRDGALTWQSVGTGESGLPLPGLSTLTAAVGRDLNGQTVYYAGTRESGLWVSRDSGDHWRRLGDQTLPATFTVTAIGLDELNPLTIFVAGTTGQGGRLFRSKDGGESFRQVYVTVEQNVALSALTIDPKDSSRVYLGTTGTGILLVSEDFGSHWRERSRFKEAIQGIAVSAQNHEEIYVLTPRTFWLSIDGGRAWQALNNQQNKAFSGRAGELVADPVDGRTFYILAGSELWRADNGGQAWQKLKLPTQSTNAALTALAIDRRDVRHLVVVFPKTILLSLDRGESWAVRDFNLAKILSRAIIDPTNRLSILLTTLQPISRGFFSF